MKGIKSPFRCAVCLDTKGLETVELIRGWWTTRCKTCHYRYGLAQTAELSAENGWLKRAKMEMKRMVKEVPNDHS